MCTILRENLNNRSCEWNTHKKIHHHQQSQRESEDDERRNVHEYRAENQTHKRNKWEKKKIIKPNQITCIIFCVLSSICLKFASTGEQKCCMSS